VSRPPSRPAAAEVGSACNPTEFTDVVLVGEVTGAATMGPTSPRSRAATRPFVPLPTPRPTGRAKAWHIDADESRCPRAQRPECGIAPGTLRWRPPHVKVLHAAGASPIAVGWPGNSKAQG
jgi:hypothetical protein